MAKGHHRSAATGRYVKASTAARNPRTTVTERGANRGSGTHHRSAITGKFVKGSTADGATSAATSSWASAGSMDSALALFVARPRGRD